MANSGAKNTILVTLSGAQSLLRAEKFLSREPESPCGDWAHGHMEGLGEDGKPEKKPRRKHNRFNGMSEEEVMKRLLPDVITPELDILIVSMTP